MVARDWKTVDLKLFVHSWGTSHKVVDIANGLYAWWYEIYQDPIYHTVDVGGVEYQWVEEPANVIEYREYVDLQAAADQKLLDDKATVAAKESEWLTIQDEQERYQAALAWKLANSEVFANSLNSTAVISKSQWETARNLPVIGAP